MVSGSSVTRGSTTGAGTSLRTLAWNSVCLGGILASAFAVILSTHNCRQAYAQLQVLEATQWYLQEEHGRLMLEHSTWASHHRVQQVAQSKLKMLAPEVAQRQVVIQ